MFYSLITNLQYSPGLIGQVTFYARRLKKEEFVRRVGLIFSVLALTVQAFLVFSPPQPSLASSSNDIIYGGGNKAKVLQSYNSNRDDLGRTDIQKIFNRYGIYAENLQNARDVVIESRAENNFYSIGRQSRFSSAIETRVDIPGAAPVYSRPLHAWDTGPYSTYTALYGTTRSGTEFWILKNCGNIVLKSSHPSPEKSTLDIEKSIKSPATYKVRPGDEITYSIRYRNMGPSSVGIMTVDDVIPKYTTYVNATGPVRSHNNGAVRWDHVDPNTNPYGILGPTTWFHEVLLTVKVNADAPNGTKLCNSATIAGANAVSDTTPPVCNEVDKPDEPTPEKPVPAAVCTSLSAERVTRTTFKIKSAGTTKDGATINKFNFYFGDNETAQANNDGSNTATVEHTYAKPGTYTINTNLVTSVGDVTSPSCSQQITINPPAGKPEIVHGKKVKNLTQDIADANGTVAKAGDRLEYRLITENLGNAAAVDFSLPEEDIADVLEYADIEEFNDAIFDKDRKTLTWPKVTIEPESKVEKVFIVKVKDPIPQTPVSASDPGSFDLTMNNKYGSDEVNIKLPPPNNKKIETVARKLPNTGIGDNIVTSTFLIGMSTYFYSRNRMISKELKLVKREFTHG